VQSALRVAGVLRRDKLRTGQKSEQELVRDRQATAAVRVVR
jgi:hypothetical protein